MHATNIKTPKSQEETTKMGSHIQEWARANCVELCSLPVYGVIRSRTRFQHYEIT